MRVKKLFRENKKEQKKNKTKQNKLNFV